MDIKVYKAWLRLNMTVNQNALDADNLAQWQRDVLNGANMAYQRSLNKLEAMENAGR